MMKRDEKNINSRSEIIQASLKEFANESYSNASINKICSENNISKGRIYHHYGGKDELYLICVKTCFEELSRVLQREVKIYDGDINRSIQSYFKARSNFFNENKELGEVLCNTNIDSPIHLKDKIKELREELDKTNEHLIKLMLSQVKLRNNISIDEAMDYFLKFEMLLDSSFKESQKDRDISKTRSIIEIHEKTITKMLDLMFYGIAKQGEEE